MKKGVSIVKSNAIETLCVKTTEKINKKYLHNFLRTSLTLHGIEPSSNIFYFYNFFETNMEYEIYYFQVEDSSQFIPEPYYLLNSFNKITTNKIYSLLYTDSFFIVVYNKEIFLFQKIENNTLVEDILLYVKQKYKIEIEYTKLYSSKEMEDISHEKIHFSHEVCFPVQKSQSLFYFIAFSILTIFSSVLFSWSDAQKEYIQKDFNKLENIQKQFMVLHQKVKNPTENIIIELNDLFLDISQKGLFIETVYFEQGKLKIKIFGSNKEELLNFAKEKPNIQINNLQKNQDEIFEMETSIEL